MTLSPRTSRIFMAMLACCAGALLVAPAAGATRIEVTTTTDEFDTGSRCSLREAIWSANNDSTTMADGCQQGNGRDFISVPAGRFNLTRTAQSPSPPSATIEDSNLYGDLDVNDQVEIRHTGIRPATINSSVGGERVFHTRASNGIVLDGLTISGGGAFAGSETRGGGILNEGDLTVRNSTISNNNAVFGAGISTEGGSTARLTNVHHLRQRRAGGRRRRLSRDQRGDRPEERHGQQQHRRLGRQRRR